jgi:uncharacterized protein YkwD
MRRNNRFAHLFLHASVHEFNGGNSMKTKFAAFLIVAILVATAHAQTQQAPPANVKLGERLLFSRANQERVQRGLQPLQWDDALYRAAQYHAQQMAQRAAISHQFSGEPDLTQRAATAGAHFNVVAENVAVVGEIGSAHDDWMKSPGHRANLLDPRLNAVAIAFELRDGRYYVAQDFLRAAPSSISSSAEEKVIAQKLSAAGLTVYATPDATDAARRTCGQDTGWVGPAKPSLTVRWTTGDLNALPDDLSRQLASRKYTAAWVGACAANTTNGFTEYSLVVMLFMQPPQFAVPVVQPPQN